MTQFPCETLIECDGIKDDCPGNTDEKDCPSCAGVCNFWPDCKDASDEDASKYGCDCRRFKCSTGNCIPKQYRCDHFLDCWPTGEDEIGCPCDGPDVILVLAFTTITNVMDSNIVQMVRMNKTALALFYVRTGPA
ncbi:unnamed protein product [Allacma fusca]|uniref:Uncharacterized protein n=1 Tax=Allacma fusca TaxID=39272 RepID=A0A8J2PA05_9HEXA|nr:unnamed protein product [Allacma fusca]